MDQHNRNNGKPPGSRRKPKEVDDDFLRQINEEILVTRDFVLLLFEKDGLKPGALLQARCDIPVAQITPMVEKPYVRKFKDPAGHLIRVVDHDRTVRKINLSKGTPAMFVDVSCEAMITGSTYVTVRLLVDEKVVSVSYEPFEEVKNNGTFFFWDEWKKIPQ